MIYKHVWELSAETIQVSIDYLRIFTWGGGVSRSHFAAQTFSKSHFPALFQFKSQSHCEIERRTPSTWFIYVMNFYTILRLVENPSDHICTQFKKNATLAPFAGIELAIPAFNCPP